METFNKYPHLVALPPSFEGEPDPKPNDGDLDPNDPRIAALVKAALDRETAGLKKNRDDLLEEKRQAANALRDLQDRYSVLGDSDPEQIAALLKQLETNEEAKLIADGKFEEVISKRTDAMRRDAEAKIAAAQRVVDEHKEQLTAAEAKIKELVIDTAVRDAAAKADVLSTAIPDIIRAAREVFSLDEEHNLIARDTGGTTLIGKDGQSNLQPSEWLDGLRDASPHYWGASQGGGAGGGTGRDGGPTPKQLDNMTGRQKLEQAIGGGAK